MAAISLPLALIAGACSSSKKAATTTGSNGSPGSTAATSKGSASASAPGAPAAPTKTSVVTEDGSKYTVTLTPKAPDPKAACANPAGAGRLVIPFSLAIQNDNPKDAAEPKLGVRVDDNGARDEVAAINVQGQCIDFTLVGNRIAQGATTTYEGSASNVTATSTLVLNINNGGPGQASSVTVPLFQKS